MRINQVCLAAIFLGCFSFFAKGQILFEDDFNGSIDPAWSIISPDTNYYSISPTELVLRASPNDIDVGGNHSAKNLFLIPSPVFGNLSITMRFNSFVPANANYAQINVMALDDDDDMVRAIYGYINGPAAEFGSEVHANWMPEAGTPLNLGGGAFYLRLTKFGSNYYQFYSTDGTNYTQINGTITYGNGNPAYLGFCAGADPTSTSLVHIDSFIVETAVPPPPVITNQPQSLLISAYASASFSVTATGLITPLSYQWSLNNSNISNATNSSLTISSATQSNVGQYQVVVTNSYGATTSAVANLYMYPFLATPFAGADTDWGFTNVLSVGAWGTGPLSYQWFDNGIAIAGATSQSLAFTNIQFTNAGLYSVVVSNGFGSVTNMAEQVVVNPAGVSLGTYPGVTITGVAGYTYAIQRNTDLGNTNGWATLTNLTLTSPVQIWVDTSVNINSPTNVQHFYRVLPGE